MPTNTPIIAIAVLTYRPHPAVLEFYSRVNREGYDLFVVVDDNKFDTGKRSGVTFVQIPDAECAQHGFYNFNPAIRKLSRCSAWDKAIYYFSRLNRAYDHVWFIEDDVFMLDMDLIPRIDARYPDQAIVSASNIRNETGEVRSWYWWRYAPVQCFDRPWARSMVCAVRVGRPVLECLDAILLADPRSLHRYSPFRLALRKVLKTFGLYRHFEDRLRFVTYPFIELIFHTIAASRGLGVAVAEEMAEIHYRMDFDLSALKEDRIYHPIKDMALQQRIRDDHARRLHPAGTTRGGGAA